MEISSVFKVSEALPPNITAVVRYDSSYGKTFLEFTGHQANIAFWLKRFAEDLAAH